MRLLLAILILLVGLNTVLAVTFTDFYCNPNAAAGCTNINAGSTATGAPVYTSIAVNWNGTTTITPTDGSTPASTVSVGMFCSVYTNGVTTNSPYIARINTVNAGANGTIVLDAVAKSGTASASVNGVLSVRVGGTWTGPYTNGGASVTFPFNFVGPNLTNAAGNMTCINFIAGTNYNTSNAITHSVNGPMRFESFTNTAHDGGRGATISGGQVVAGYTLFTASGNHVDYDGITFLNNGATLTSDLFAASGADNLYRGCSFINSRGSGVNVSALSLFVECEATTNNLSNTVNKGGFENAVAQTVYLRCTSHDSTNINAAGWYCSQPCTLIKPIISNVGSNGVSVATTGEPIIILDAEINKVGKSGVNMSSTPAVSQLVYIENGNFITNGNFGIEGALGAIYKRNGAFYNLGMGSGNATNLTGNVSTNMGSIFTNGFVTYSSGAVPWVDSTNGFFKLTSPSWHVGRGGFTFTSVGYSNTVSYSDIGAAQNQGITNGVTSFSSQ